MLYDVFICHASEDKENFVRPLANALKNSNVEVWYDEFSLKLGDSIRSSIDKGLRQSRFGVVVLSEAFFAKQWTQYELDGLNEIELKGRDVVLLPVWHGVEHARVLTYSPSLAGRKAANSSLGIDAVVAQVLNVVRPEGSPFIRARDVLIDWGITPPVITDEFWLDVVEASNRIPAYGPHIPEESTWGRWSFPLPDRAPRGERRGEYLAWAAMQLLWTDAAEREAITPLTQPEKVHAFIWRHAGLPETCSAYPTLLAEYAPQLTIPGFEGEFLGEIESAFQDSCKNSSRIGKSNKKYRSHTTRNRTTPLCEEEWAVRHETFGNMRPYAVANAYFHGGMFGPTVSPYEDADHLFWLLSSQSDWLPEKLRDVLKKGLACSRNVMTSRDSRMPQTGPTCDAFVDAIFEAIEGRKRFKWNDLIEEDLLNRIELSRNDLGFSESSREILGAFVSLGVPKLMLAEERSIRAAQKARS